MVKGKKGDKGGTQSPTPNDDDLVEVTEEKIRSISDVAKAMSKMATKLDKLDRLEINSIEIKEELSKIKRSNEDTFAEICNAQDRLEKKTAELDDKVGKIDYQLHDQKTKTASMAERLRHVEEKLVAAEWKEVQNNMRLHKIPMHPDAKEGSETEQQTKELVMDFFRKIGLDDKIGQFSCTRFRINDRKSDDKQENTPQRPPQIRLRLSAPWQRPMIFKALKANGAGQDVGVQLEHPASLSSLKRKLVQKGVNLCKGTDTKFRVIRERNTLILQVKTPDKDFYWEPV